MSYEKLGKDSILPLVFLSVLIFDQAAKYLVSKLGYSVVCNKGFIFGFGQSNLLLPFIVLLFLAILLFNERKTQYVLPIALVFSGGFSNFLDRIFVGCVRDFIFLKHFWAFNLADVAITLGVLVLVYSFAKHRLSASR